MTTETTHFFRNDLTGNFYRAGAWNETDPNLADHLNATEEAFLRTVWDCSNVTRFPTEPEPSAPEVGWGGFFYALGRSQA